MTLGELIDRLQNVPTNMRGSEVFAVTDDQETLAVWAVRFDPFSSVVAIDVIPQEDK